MLQPLQLQEVSLHYAEEIAELQDFFGKTNCPSGAEALHTIAYWLAHEPAFHRDLTSHIWVVIHPRNQNISYADLLGILAISAAGEHAAAEAGEDDVHALLGFLMEARQSLADTRARTSSTHAAQPLAAPAPIPSLRPSSASLPAQLRPQSAIRPIAQPPALRRQPAPLSTRSLSDEPEEPNKSSRRLLWIAAPLLAAIAIGAALHYRSTPQPAPTPAPAPTVAISPTPTAIEPTTPIPATPLAEPEPTPPHKAAPTASRTASPLKGTARSASSLTGPRIATPPPAAAQPSLPTHPANPVPVTTATAAPPASATTTPPPALKPTPTPAAKPASPPSPFARIPPPPARAAAPVNLKASPSYTESTTLTPNSTTRTHQTPVLRRRTPAEQQEALAAARATGPVIATAPPPVVAPAASQGTVQAMSVGAYASNVVYSPIPTYPPEASAAHVQGEVKLLTEVDRTGKVASVRVVSGPPLLRAASLDAAQRWRYEPGHAGPTTIPITAITVFEFKLP